MWKFSKIIQYSLACFCVYVIFLWNGVKPPVINFDDIRELQGTYMCYVSGGSSRSGDERIDGVRYSARFSYIFGIKRPGSCFEKINKNSVSIKYILAGDSRILLEILNLNDGKIYGNPVGKSIKNIKRDVQDESSIIFTKFFALIILVCLMAWRRVKQVFSKIWKLSKLGE